MRSKLCVSRVSPRKSRLSQLLAVLSEMHEKLARPLPHWPCSFQNVLGSVRPAFFARLGCLPMISVCARTTEALTFIFALLLLHVLSQLPYCIAAVLSHCFPTEGHQPKGASTLAEKRARRAVGGKTRASGAAARQGFFCREPIGPCTILRGAPLAAGEETNQSVPVRDVRASSGSDADPPGGSFGMSAVGRWLACLSRPFARRRRDFAARPPRCAASSVAVSPPKR